MDVKQTVSPQSEKLPDLCISNMHSNPKKKKKYLQFKNIFFLSTVLFLCGCIAATLGISLNKPTTIIITANTEIITTTSTITTTTSVTTLSTSTTTNNPPLQTVFWSFDNQTNDMYNIYNGITQNAPNYVIGYTGLNSEALNFTSSLSQLVIVNSPFFNFSYRSFTIEYWFYPTLVTSSDSGIFGQCDTASTDLCLVHLIRNYYLRFAFYNDDLIGVTIITANKWHHAAFVYDYTTSTQILYLNGFREGNRTASHYKGQHGNITIGGARYPSYSYFDGFIDQVSIVTRAKTDSEVRFDATVVCYYPFDSNSFFDSGPLGLNGTSSGITFVSGQGRINDAILFTSSNSYFTSGGMTLLGTTNQPYSFVVWIKPTSLVNGMIVFVSKYNYESSLNWCMPFIGLTSSGQIAIQSWSSTNNGSLVYIIGPSIPTGFWTHIAHTYSPTNGIRLYVNGLLYQQSSGFTYLASNSPNYIYLGSFPFTTCQTTSSVISRSQFYGEMDEFYLYSREITANEVNSLANV